METKTKVIIAAVALLTSFAAGRWLAPEKIKIETKTVEVEKKTDQTHTDADRDRRRETTKTTIQKPDGTVETTEKTVDTTETHKTTDSKDTQSDVTTKDQTKEITRPSDKVTVAALAGVKFSSLTQSPILYGGQVYKPVLGPVGVGVWGLSDLSFGVSIGLSF